MGPLPEEGIGLDNVCPSPQPSPRKRIPALVTDDGEVLFDSPVICEYLDSLAGGGKVFPPPGKARWAALRQQALGDGILDALILCRYEIAARPEEKRFAGWTDGQMAKAHQALAALEGEEFSGPPTIGTITAACTLGYLDFRFPNDGWRTRHPKLAAWYQGIEALPAMQATRPPAG